MKRFFASAAALTASFCLAACSVTGGGSTSRKNGLDCAFQSSMSLTMDRLTAEGTLTRAGSGEWQVEFDSPNTLSGVTLSLSQGEVTASYKGLSFSVPRSALPVKAMMLNLAEAVDSCSGQEELSGKEEDGSLIVSGSLEGGEYSITVDGNGALTAFEMPGSKLKIVFTDVTVIEPSLTHETTEGETGAAEEISTEQVSENS